MTLSEEESGAALSARDALWSLAIAQQQKILITATEWDELMTILFLNETATFQLSEAISKMQIGDIAGRKIVN